MRIGDHRRRHVHRFFSLRNWRAPQACPQAVPSATGDTTAEGKAADGPQPHREEIAAGADCGGELLGSSALLKVARSTAMLVDGGRVVQGSG